MKSIKSMFNSTKESIKGRINKITHDQQTGEKLTPIADEIDQLTMIGARRQLTAKELKKMRPYTVGKTVVVASGAVATGVVVGKTVYTSTLLSLGAYIVYDAILYKPFQALTSKVTK